MSTVTSLVINPLGSKQFGWGHTPHLRGNPETRKCSLDSAINCRYPKRCRHSIQRRRFGCRRIIFGSCSGCKQLQDRCGVFLIYAPSAVGHWYLAATTGLREASEKKTFDFKSKILQQKERCESLAAACDASCWNAEMYFWLHSIRILFHNWCGWTNIIKWNINFGDYWFHARRFNTFGRVADVTFTSMLFSSRNESWN